MDVREVLQQFYDDPYAQGLKQDWLLNAPKVLENFRHDTEHVAKVWESPADDLFLSAQRQGITSMHLSKHTLASCALFRYLLSLQKPKGKPLPFASTSSQP